MGAVVRELDLDHDADKQSVIELFFELQASGRQRYNYGAMPASKKRRVETELIPLLKSLDVGTRSFGAFVNREPAGIAICQTALSTWCLTRVLNIHDLYVRPQYRRSGIASKLLEACENAAQSIGCAKLTVETTLGNMPGRRLYHKRGYRGTGLAPDGTFALIHGMGNIAHDSGVVLQMTRDLHSSADD